MFCPIYLQEYNVTGRTKKCFTALAVCSVIESMWSSVLIFIHRLYIRRCSNAFLLFSDVFPKNFSSTLQSVFHSTRCYAYRLQNAGMCLFKTRIYFKLSEFLWQYCNSKNKFTIFRKYFKKYQWPRRLSNKR